MSFLAGYDCSFECRDILPVIEFKIHDDNICKMQYTVVGTKEVLTNDWYSELPLLCV